VHFRCTAPDRITSIFGNNATAEVTVVLRQQTPRIFLAWAHPPESCYCRQISDQMEKNQGLVLRAPSTCMCSVQPPYLLPFSPHLSWRRIVFMAACRSVRLTATARVRIAPDKRLTVAAPRRAPRVRNTQIFCKMMTFIL
jgi:hypothetical protein